MSAATATTSLDATDAGVGGDDGSALCGRFVYDITWFDGQYYYSEGSFWGVNYWFDVDVIVMFILLAYHNLCIPYL